MDLRFGPILTTSPIHEQEPVKDYSELPDDVSAGTLTFVSGAVNMELFSDIRNENLYEACFEGVVPEIQSFRGSITVDYEQGYSFPNFHKSRGNISVNGFIPWDLVFYGGVAAVTADLRGMHLNSLEVNGGINHVRLTLPRPNGIVPVRFNGGVNSLTILRPPEVDMQLDIAGGAFNLSFDHYHFQIVGDETHLQTPSFNEADNGYIIHAGGGSRNLTVVVIDR